MGIEDGTSSKKVQKNSIKISTSKNKIETERGNITEWYINEESGLEQGFTIFEPLNKGNLQKIDIKISGDLLLKISDDGQAVTFYKKNLSVLNYGNLIVKDSRGKILSSHFEGFSGGISIVFDVEGAIYPITVDQILTGPEWIDSGLMEKDLLATTSSPPPLCVPPDEPCWIYLETKSVPDDYPIIHWLDLNQTNQITGWNVRRSNNPSDIWYYQVTAYNANCLAE